MKGFLSAAAAIIAVIAVACGSPGELMDDSGPGDGAATATPEATEDFSVPLVARGWPTDWSKRSIDLNELLAGIRGVSDSRDAIPPIDDPRFESVEDADQWLEDREPVALLELNGEARAYPLRILTWHEIVNDVVAGTAVAVTFCPLCNSAVGFNRTVDGQALRFGVSGLLRKSDLVMWDDATVSLWQQITGEAIVGEMTGRQLEMIPTPLISWGQFKERFPQGLVLSRDTGFARQYGVNPYQGYDSSARPFLFTGEVDDRFPAMERVVGVTVNGANKAYPFSVLADEAVVNDEVGGEPIVVFWGAADTASALDNPTISEGRAVGVGVAYLRTVGDRVLTFESAGEDLFADVETGTTWDLLGNAIDGPLAGEKLTPAVHTNHFWFSWAAFNEGAPVHGG
jgi:hypothetical protein